jgi:hypothetical protein
MGRGPADRDVIGTSAVEIVDTRSSDQHVAARSAVQALVVGPAAQQPGFFARPPLLPVIEKPGEACREMCDDL